MPKVDAAYVQTKKEQIMDAALQVFAEKPLFAVTMQDVINRVGFSQGAIYRYYGDIDDIIIAVHNRFFAEVDYAGSLEDILRKQLPPEQVIRQAFACMAASMKASMGVFSKIRLEWLLLYSAYPKRGEKIQKALHVGNSNTLVLQAATAYIAQQVEKGYFKPVLPLPQIVSFVTVSCDGIFFDDLFFKNQQQNTNLQPRIPFEVTQLFDTLCTAVIQMLGGKTDD